MYWVFEEENLKNTDGMQSASIIPSVSKQGDDCHRDVISSTGKGQRSFVLNYCKPPNLYFETGEGDDVQIQHDTYKELGSLLSA